MGSLNRRGVLQVLRYFWTSRKAMIDHSQAHLAVDASRIGNRNCMIGCLSNRTGQVCWAPPQVAPGAILAPMNIFGAIFVLGPRAGFPFETNPKWVYSTMVILPFCGQCQTTDCLKMRDCLQITRHIFKIPPNQHVSKRISELAQNEIVLGI